MGNTVGKKLDNDRREELEAFLEGNALCNSSVLGPAGFQKMIKWARCIELENNQYLFKNGDSIKFVYFVRAGYLHISDKDDNVGGLLLTTGALVDAGKMKGSGKVTENRNEYVTTAKVASQCRAAEVFAIPMSRYKSALEKLLQVVRSKEFQVLRETALFHDLHHSDLMRIYNHSDLREYSPGSHILRKGAKQSFRMYIIIKGACTATDYVDKNANHTASDGLKEHATGRPVTLRSPAYFNEEGLIRLIEGGTEGVDDNMHSEEVVIYSNKFRRSVVKRNKGGKCGMSVKVGKTGCTVLTISYEAFHEHCVGMSDHYYTHFMRRMEDVEIAAKGALLAEQTYLGGGVTADLGKVANLSSPESKVAAGVEEELLHIKGLKYHNPEVKDLAVFNIAPILEVRVLKKPFAKSLLDCSSEDVKLHFDVMRHGESSRDERMRDSTNTQKSDKEVAGAPAQNGREYCYLDLRQKIGDHDFEQSSGIPTVEGKKDKKGKAKKKEKRGQEGASRETGQAPPSTPSLMASLFPPLLNEKAGAAKNNVDSSDEEYGSALQSSQGNSSGLERSDRETLESAASDGLGSPVVNALEGIFSLVGVVPAATAEQEETMDAVEEGEKEVDKEGEEPSDEPARRSRRFTSTSPVNASQYSSRASRRSFAKIRSTEGDNTDEKYVTYVEADSPVDKVGNNVLFGIFDSVLCGAPDILCGDGKTGVTGISKTPVA